MNPNEAYLRWQLQARELPTPILAVAIRTTCRALEFGQMSPEIGLGQLEVMIIEQARRFQRADPAPAP